MIQAVVSAILTKEHIEKGFYLEDDEDFVYLKYSGKTVAKWNGRRAKSQPSVIIHIGFSCIPLIHSSSFLVAIWCARCLLISKRTPSFVGPIP